VVLHAKPGDRVEKGQVLMTLLSDDTDRFERAEQALESAYEIEPESQTSPEAASRDLILDRIP
jgi:thymidine phosphorylase